MSVCGDCKFYAPHVDVITRRVHPSKAGKCSWKPQVVWPMAHRRQYGGQWGERDPFIDSGPVWKTTNASGCKVWTPKDPKNNQCLVNLPLYDTY